MTLPDGKYGIVILAAGNSSRLGRPKQLLKFRGKSLIRHTTDEAVKVAGNQVVVVTGANNGLVEDELHTSTATIIYNQYWEEGISSSVCTGLITLLKTFPNLDGVIFAVCDQPFISSVVFKKLIGTNNESDKGIIASSYGNSAGVPVLFDYKYFGELLKLKGQEGAKILLEKFADDVERIPFEKGDIDIDTAEAYDDLIKTA